jgi:hypothetical protein
MAENGSILLAIDTGTIVKTSENSSNLLHASEIVNGSSKKSTVC